MRYSLEQLAGISHLYQVEPNLEVAASLDISGEDLMGFYFELPKPSKELVSTSGLATCGNHALSLCEQLKMLADGTCREFPRNLRKVLLAGLSRHKHKMLMIACILAEIDSEDQGSQ
ncbi:hypothetical protein IEN85_19335 [Pelagicoccus sp. NFK12]|uniref:Uncharacterized protein n=1 Tax=Pelagicoccus enzymogenes TaxID=2773457 RepID=A0A927IJC8_9BACT|nr:hypothetical protein [Pelagicoccus enzymogenes]MBD5781663.1 hypothetical protein [Pelagicoccus enzymogenes]